MAFCNIQIASVVDRFDLKPSRQFGIMTLYVRLSNSR